MSGPKGLATLLIASVPLLVAATLGDHAESPRSLSDRFFHRFLFESSGLPQSESSKVPHIKSWLAFLASFASSP